MGTSLKNVSLRISSNYQSRTHLRVRRYDLRSKALENTNSLWEIIMTRLISLAVLVSLTLTGFVVADEKNNKQTRREKAEAKFTELLTDVTLVGRFSVTANDEEKASKPDRYKIQKVEKLPNGRWMFYYEKSPKVVITIPLAVAFTGDTPMIAMTNQTIPGVGTFSCRIIFYDNLYTGTWRHGKTIGHMWGRIEKSRKK